ncbi:hypothetical protein ACEN19_04845 [Corynebacterium auriscanis]|uniref:hypothetical protein n=1 Tax=Corynebacterium auriscanis TaxID=99807 RepID=UPI003CF7D203
MISFQAFSRWIERWEEKRVARWYQRQERASSYLTNWRNWPRQKLLISIYFGCLFSYLCILAAQVVWNRALLLTLPVTVVLLTAWIMLRITIDSRDGAPEEVLDEYEAKVISRWTRLSWNLLTLVCTAICWILVFASTHLGGQQHDGVTNPTVLGLTPADFFYNTSCVFLAFFLAIVALPAMGYAMHFGPRPATDEVDDGVWIPSDN